jgi:hypothetical protein
MEFVTARRELTEKDYEELVTQLALSVKRGAALLDDWFEPLVWRTRINLAELDVAECHLCVLGQLFPSSQSFETTLHTLSITAVEGQAHGFTYPSEGALGRFSTTAAGRWIKDEIVWGALTEAWRRELAPA